MEKLNKKLNLECEKIKQLTLKLGYPVAYDIKTGKILKVNDVKKIYQITKDGKTINIDDDEIVDVRKLVR